MSHCSAVTRRKFLQAAAVASAATIVPGVRTSLALGAPDGEARIVLQEFGYGDVSLDGSIHEHQLQQTHQLLMSLSEDSLLKPFRLMIGKPAPGEDLGGWYRYDPDYDWHTFDAGFAPSATFGQWVSAMDSFTLTTASLLTVTTS
jgi:hypothetical protein